MHKPSPLHLQQYRSHLKRFTEFTDKEWEIFSNVLYLKRLRKKDLLVSAEKICNEVCFISSGSFRIYFIKDGIEFSTYFCFQNELISAYPSFLKREPAGVYIECMDAAELVCFSYESLQKLLSDDRVAFRMENYGRKIAEYLICCYEERVLSFLSQTPEQRYLHLLETQPDFLQKIPQHYLANYLGITPVSLSRIRRRIFATREKQKLVS
jgi:CRP-like cAMP-binding protein